MLSVFCYILTIILLVAKLGGWLAISWFLVVLPALIPLTLLGTALFVATMAIFAAAIFASKKSRFTVRTRLR